MYIFSFIVKNSLLAVFLSLTITHISMAEEKKALQNSKIEKRDLMSRQHTDLSNSKFQPTKANNVIAPQNKTEKFDSTVSKAHLAIAKQTNSLSPGQKPTVAKSNKPTNSASSNRPTRSSLANKPTSSASSNRPTRSALNAEAARLPAISNTAIISPFLPLEVK